MAFYLYTSNKLDTLAEIYAKLHLDSQLQNPFSPEIIVVQSLGMAAWLKQQLAEQRGTAANIQFPFINKMIDIVLETTGEVSDYNPQAFTTEVLTWRIFNMLFTLPIELHSLENYLRGTNRELKQYQLATKIAGLFDQYQIYRPDLMKEWSSRPLIQGDNWQKFIWQQLSQNQISRSERLLRFLSGPDHCQLKKFKTISVFGISTVPPIYLRCFEKVSQTIDVHFFYVNPCKKFWEDQVSDKEQEYQGFDELDAMFCDNANPLLANLGRHGREFFSVMMQSPLIKIENEVFSDIEREDILSTVQQDILEMESPGEKLEHTYPGTDNSIQVHICHNKMREIEILYDNILSIIENDAIQPRDILVMAPDIMAYAPYINVVFGDRNIPHESCMIPYDISDQSLVSYSQIVSSFIELLKLAQARFTVNSIFDLLEIGQIHSAFGLQDKDLEKIRKWLADTRVHWGVDGLHREELGGFRFDEYSWRSGIKRMLLGFAINDPDDRIVINGISPYDQIEGDSSIVLGKFIEFVEALFALSSDLKRARTIDAWSDKLLSVLDQFFISDNESYSDISFLRQAIMQLQVYAEKSEMTASVGIDVIRNYLSDVSEQSTNSTSFLRGKVTFCTMQPMRSIPRKAICLIGMNDGEFPRSDMKIGFNLIARQVKLCDRDRRYEDRYLFLEALLSARKKLYISYHGRSEKDNSILPAANPVCELLDYIDQRFRPDGIAKMLQTEHKLQAFNPAYFDSKNNKLFSYSQENKDAAEALINPPAEMPFFSMPAPVIMAKETIEIDELIKFFNNPADYFLQYSLGTNVKEYQAEQLSDVEPFSLDQLDGYCVNQEIFADIIAGKNKEDIYQNLKFKQLLEVGEPGKFSFDDRYHEIAGFIHDCNLAKRLAACQTKRFITSCGDVNISGRLEYLNRLGNSTESYRIRYAKINGKDMISAWLYHLAATLFFPDSDVTTMVFTKDKQEAFKVITRDEAAAYLEELLEIYRDGLIRPLPFFCKTSYIYAITGPKKKSERPLEQIKLTEARKMFMPGDYNFNAEGGNNAVKLCFPENTILETGEFKELALKIFNFCAIMETVQRPLIEEIPSI